MTLEIGGLVLLVVVALVLVVPIYRSGTRQKLQATWPRVDARVQEHRLRVVEQIRGFAEYRVEYEYGGATCTRWVGAPDGSSHTMVASSSAGISVEEAVRHRMARHPVGSTLEVMVNPANPDEVFKVEREFPARLAAYALTVVFLAFFAAFLYVAYA